MPIKIKNEIRNCFLLLVLFFIVSLTAESSDMAISKEKKDPPSGRKKVEGLIDEKHGKEKIIFQVRPEEFEYNYIRSIVKDYKGYLWFATIDGLVRFDGINTYLYSHNPDDSTSLCNSAINALAEDKDGNLWIGTAKGLDLYNRAMDNFIHVGNLNENIRRLNNNYISDLAVDQNSNLWVGTYGDGLHVLTSKKLEISHYAYNSEKPDSLHTNLITCLLVDNDNDIWVGSQNGISIFHGEEKKFTHLNHDPAITESLSSNFITAMALDKQGNIWVGTRTDGVDQISKVKDGFSFKHFGSNSGKYQLDAYNILSLCADNKGYIWVGTENGGLNRISVNTGNIDHYEVEEGNKYSLISNSIWYLYYDREEKLWIGTATKGINVIDDNFSKFETYQNNNFDKNSLTDNDVTGFAENSEGDVWVATDGGGICKFEPDRKIFTKSIVTTANTRGLINNAVKTIACDVNDELWVGTWAGGIDRLTKEGQKIRNYKLISENGGGNNNVLTLYIDSDHNIFAGTAGSGLFRYDPKLDSFRQVVCRNATFIVTSTAFVTSILEDSDGALWIGSLYGLAKIALAENGEYEAIDFPRGDQNNTSNVRAIEILYEDSRGRLWIGTSDQGLFLFDKKRYDFVETNSRIKLPNMTVKGILEDNLGYLWVSTRKGICRFLYDSGTYTIFNRDDGLNSNEFYERSCLKTKEGQFFFGEEKGMNVFYPWDIRKNTLVPPVYLTCLKINNIPVNPGDEKSPLIKQISESDEIVLNYKQTSFTIEYIALNYTRPSRNQYLYMLEGFDEGWIDAGNSRSATYTNIKPGEYIFMVKGSNNDGVWNDKPTSLKIVVKPPFWKTWWAVLTYIVFISALIAIALIMLNERIHIKHQLRLEQLGREKEHELNEANIQFFTNISHEFRTPLSLIIAPVESLILSAPLKIMEQLMVIYRNAQRLIYLTNNLMDFRKLEEGRTSLKVKNGEVNSFIREVSSYFKLNFQRRNIQFSLTSSEEVIQGWFDPEKLETILFNLLSNASKYTPDGGSIQVHVTTLAPAEVMDKYKLAPGTMQADSRFLEIAISDNGTGISPADLPFVFDKFYQSASASKLKNQGTGIGLALTKGLVELNHGHIVATSVPNRETCFSFAVPFDRSLFSSNEILNEPTSVLNRSLIIEPEVDGLKTNEKESSDEETIKEQAVVLLVEDNYELRTFLVNALGKSYTILQADDGRPGIELAIENGPDLIISDILMTECSGLELCRVLKSDIRTSHIPIILLTAKSAISDQIEGAEIGADVYITKPFNMQLLEAKINQLIQSRRKLFAHFSQEVYIMPNKMAENELDQKFLQRTINYIVGNIADNNLNVENLSLELNLSRSNVYRKIKALTGKTIIEFIRNIRLKQAVKLMESKKYSLAEIAYLTGFTSPSYFTKSFKDQYGKPPSEYLSS